MTGKRGNDKSFIQELNNPNIIFTGYVSEEELSCLMGNALLYCSPSIYEGFGTPNIEAQYSGIPVLCSDIPIYRETMENSAEFCSTDWQGIAKKLEYLINNQQRRNELIALGYTNVKRFSFEKILQQLKETLNLVRQ